MTQDFVNKIEYSFSTLVNNNGRFSIFDELVKETWSNDPEGELILETVYKILDLFNTSTPEQQENLFNSEVSDVIKMLK